MRVARLASIFAVIVTLTIAGSAFAANPVNIQIMAVEEKPGEMVLTVSAVDERGKPFPGLDTSNFNAWINDTPLIIRGLQTETARLPASVLLLVDVSGSMAGDPMNQAKAAMQQFLDGLDPKDQVAVMSFANNVQLLQDFTSDRAALGQAVTRLTPVGETALYDGVIQSTAKMAEAPEGRKLVVLLSDGAGTVGTNKRAQSLQAAHDSQVGFVAVALGTGIDKKYLGELTATSGGRLLEASTPAALKQAYTDLASAIRSQYTLQVEVPRSIDRTVPGQLKVHAIYRADNAFAERALDALPGALPPPFQMMLKGLAPGDKPNGVVSLLPAVQEGIEVVKVDYILDDNVIHTTDGSALGFDLDASTLGTGNHVLKIVATDAAGREGEVQVPFIIPELVAAGGGVSIPIVPLAILALLAGIGYLGYRLFWTKIRQIASGGSSGDAYESRVGSWASVRPSGQVQRPEEWPERRDPVAMAATATADAAVRGRVVIMDEAAVRGGELESIREFEMRSTPLTFGSGPGVDMRVGDAGGMIAAEEARVWVQRGRMVYHKLTTLSAMATEGVTAGWQFLEDGDEMRIGPYRLVFQAQQAEEAEDEIVLAPDRLPQEHGMALRPTDERVGGLQGWASDESPAFPRERFDSGSRESPGMHSLDPSGQDTASSWGDAVAEQPASSRGDDAEAQPSRWSSDEAAPKAFEWNAATNDRDESTSRSTGEAEPCASGWGLSVGDHAAGAWEGSESAQSWAIEGSEAVESTGRNSDEAEQGALEEGSSETPAAPSFEWGEGSGENTTSSGAAGEGGAEADDEESSGQVVQPGAWNADEEEEGLSSWKSGERGMEADEGEEDEPGRAWGT